MPRLRPRTALAALAFAGLVLTACTPPSNEPEGYDDTTRANFIQGCTGIVTEGTALDATTSSIGEGADPTTCECQYNWFVENVFFDADAAKAANQPDAVNFVELNQQVEDDPESLPQDIKDGLQQACGTAGSGASTPGTSEIQAGTTVAPSDTAADTTTSTP